MDLLTQATLGSLCGELTLRKQVGWKGAVWGAFFGLLPDADAFISSMDSLEWLRIHRGLSHSLLLIIVASPLLGKLLAKIHDSISFWRGTVFILLVLSTHVLIDCFNTYGTQIFEPFSDRRVALNNMSIIDPLFTTPMLLGNFICLWLAKNGAKRSWVTWTTTAWIILYTLASFTLQHQAKQHFNTQLSHSNIDTADMFVSPSIGNILLWRMLARDDNNYYVSYWSVFDSPDRPIYIDSIAHTPEVANDIKECEAFETLHWFSQGWWKTYPDPEDPNTIYFVDLRFGETKLPDDKQTLKIPPFIWKLTLENDGNVSQQRVSYRKKFKPAEILTNLKERVLGRAPDWHEAHWPWDNLKTL